MAVYERMRCVEVRQRNVKQAHCNVLGGKRPAEHEGSPQEYSGIAGMVLT
jgi:hypothetical protein